MVGLVVKPSYAGKSSWNGEGKFVFWPIASWDGVNPSSFGGSSNIFSIIRSMVAWLCWFKPLAHGLYAAVC